MQEPRPKLANAVRAIGVILVVMGAAHWLGYARSFFARGDGYGVRTAYALWIGAFMVFGGLLQAIASGGIRQGERWGWRVSAVASAMMVVFSASLIPVLLAGGNLFVVAPILFQVAHLTLLVGYARDWRRERAAARAPEPQLQPPAV